MPKLSTAWVFADKFYPIPTKAYDEAMDRIYGKKEVDPGDEQPQPEGFEHYVGPAIGFHVVGGEVDICGVQHQVTALNRGKQTIWVVKASK